MKNQMLLSVLLFFTIITPTLGQQDFERKTAIEIEERANYFHVNEQYQIISDTIFYSKPGFLIHPHFDNYKDAGGKEYIIITYPDFKPGKKRSTVHNVSYSSKLESVSPPNSKNGSRVPIDGKNGGILMIEKNKFEKLPKTTLYGINFKDFSNYKISTGLLTVPFKLRPKQDTLDFTLTTDVTLGLYFGITKRLSKKEPFYATLPFTLGLSFINVNDNTTSAEFNDNQIGVVPGVSWSTGIIFQFNKFNIGFVLGKDYASDIGSNWAYHKKLWYSFAIGYSFLSTEKSN